MKVKPLIILLFLFNTTYLLAQNQYEEKLAQFITEQKQEKVYIHFDKPQYAAGENIWFKAYITNAVTHQPTDVSSTLYVELINQEKNIVDSLTLFIDNGKSNGSFILKRDLKSGSYRIRAYTKWMRNYDNDFFFQRDFEIVNPSFIQNEESNQKDGTLSEKPILEFLPEGGDLIDGIPTKIGIKLTTRNAADTPLNGIIINSKEEKISDFKLNNLGYGLCFFIPKIGESYRAVFNKDTFNLPIVENAGASIKVTHSQKSDYVRIAVLSKNIDLKDGTLVLHRRGKLLVSKNCTSSTSMSLTVKKFQLETGIIHVTFFDRNKVPLSERLIFPNPPSKEPAISIDPDRTTYTKRSKIKLELNSKNDTVHSASITINPLLESSYEKYGENIENYLLMSSDLKGKIKSPDSYFAGTKEAYEALDLLMLIHGWSRFNWTSLLENESFVPEHFPEKGITIKGKAVNYYNNAALKEPVIGVTIPSIGILNETFSIKEDGEFQLVGLKLMDSTKIYIQAFREKKEKLKNYQTAKIQLESPLRPNVNNSPQALNDINPDFLEKAEKLKKISSAYFLDDDLTELDEIVVTAKSIKQTEMERRTSLYKEPDSRIIMDSIRVNFLSIFDALQRVSGVTVVGSFPNYSARIRGISSLNGSLETLYILDGMQVDNTALQNIPIQDVEFIDVLKGPSAAIFGSRGAAGVILVYTRLGSSNNQKDIGPTGLLAFTHPGYHKAKEFYSPQYDEEREEHIIPDYRTTLHWNPELKFENNRSETTFYSSDQTGNYIVRIEGIFTNGKPFFEEIFVNVE